MLIGREPEKQTLIDSINEEDSKFIAVYGRRRVGKTYLIREVFDNNFTFAHAGLSDGTYEQQLYAFSESLKRFGLKEFPEIKNWLDAFERLKDLIEQNKSKKKVIFLDELAWLDTPKSGLIVALENFWNSWASGRKDIVLIVCASATSWMVDKIIHNKGGLYNRLSAQIHVKPFKLAECHSFLESKKIIMNPYEILELYMAIGGIPYYWTFVKKGKSAAQNIDHLFFEEQAPLKDEYKYLYSSLFKNPEKHIAIVETLAKIKIGMTRDEIIKTAKMPNSGNITKILNELISCGFIRKYTPFMKKNRDSLFQLIDNYTLFYFQFLEKEPQDEHFWSNDLSSSTKKAWCGTAFERVCLEHISEIKQKLGISGVSTNVHSWFCKADKGIGLNGAQIDLLIVRRDKIINVCEMKFSQENYSFTKKDDESLRNKIGAFKTVTKTKFSVHPTLVTTYGLNEGLYSGNIQSVITAEDLFKKS